MKSIWQEEIDLKKREKLTGELHTKAAVIGGGMAGILTAFLLQEAGIPVILLEAERIAGGQTGGTTAKITSQHGMIYQYLTETFGLEQAGQYASANQQAIGEFERIIRERRIDCEFTRCPSYLYAMEGDESGQNVEKLKAEIQAANALGIEAGFTAETELPFPVAGAEVFWDQARFHPLKFIRGISEKLCIYEHSRVLRMEDNCIFTEEGMLEADHVVFASHFPWMGLPGYYFMRMYQERSYVLALRGVKQMQGIYRDMDEHGLSFRSSGNYLLLGGGSHRTGENAEGGNYDALEKQARILYPEGAGMAQWSAQDCMTMDRVPYIGYLVSGIPNWYVAAGFGKWGMTTSMASAMILRDMILGQENKNEEIFSPQRFQFQAAAKPLMDQGVQGVKGLTRRVFSFPVEKDGSLSAGQGGIVEYEGKKAGVYRDLDGSIYAVSVKCPHMGCELSWNPDDKSWDCPCHGSRFDFKGNLISGPAQEDLER